MTATNDPTAPGHNVRVLRKKILRLLLTMLLPCYPQSIQRTPIVLQIRAPHNTLNEALAQKKYPIFDAMRPLFEKMSPIPHQLHHVGVSH